MADGSGDEGTVGGHLGHARGEVVAVLVAVLGEEGSEKLLDTVEGTGREHLGAERVRLELLNVGLCICAKCDLLAWNSRIGRRPLVRAFMSAHGDSPAVPCQVTPPMGVATKQANGRAHERHDRGWRWPC